MLCEELAGLVLEDEVEYMDTSDRPWCWYYKAKCGVWHRVEDDPKGFMSSDDLERYYLRNPQGVITMTTTGASTQVNLKTGKEKRIKRSFQTENGFRCKCDEISPSPPAHWKDVDPKKPYQLISLGKGGSEYQAVERFVRDNGLLHDPIISIKRIQNMDLWELFCRKKIQLMRIKGQSDIEEQMLFHGTDAKNVQSICTFNFNCRLSDKKRRGHVYGKGTYFAKHASFANKYSNTRQGTKVMLLARVIVGKYKTGHEDYCTPNDDQNENIHDSCVDNTLYPRVFVIFDSNQIYPEYVLEYHSN
ncbi:protein mono-ADP-ribosyltransferase PARP11 isoform X2 [Onychostoma macrolepis]|uniref:protein mono-ADP-ribosyltransferase PARP11 isoform X2 n=1 Tax=Onychostoma macrolepis TaxID=369639 RepID=UPI00272B0804|nr:protein mono-ADP-ribosyltransferase PARP11 isoform X2 [Onychostoma macrolepis]